MMWPFTRRADDVAQRLEPRLLNASPENPSTNLADPASWLTDWASGGVPGAFGPNVSERTSMCCSAVYRCVALNSGAVAGLPLKVYKRTKDGREEAFGHRLWPMFQMTPFPGRAMTAFTWKELWMINMLLWGNHVSIIRYDGAARIIGFESVMPWDVEVYRLNNRNVYRCAVWDSSFGPDAAGLTQRIEWHDQDDIIHIPGPGFNGISGLSRIRSFARNSIALSQLLEEQTGRVHENAAKPSGLATTAPTISKEGFERFKAQFNEQNTGRVNAGKVIIGDKDTTFTPFQMTPEDLNTIEFRGYQVADISRFFGVPLHLLNQVDKSSSWGTGLSEQTLAFLIYTLDPDLGRIEAELNYKLFYGTDYYVEFDRDALMAMDPLKSAQVAQTEISTGVLLINERRRHKNRPPVENGDQPLINSTNVPLAKIFIAAAQPVADPITPGAGDAPDPSDPTEDPPEPGGADDPDPEEN
jgi:HK97 family phage portal protein